MVAVTSNLCSWQYLSQMTILLMILLMSNWLVLNNDAWIIPPSPLTSSSFRVQSRGATRPSSSSISHFAKKKILPQEDTTNFVDVDFERVENSKDYNLKKKKKKTKSKSGTKNQKLTSKEFQLQENKEEDDNEKTLLDISFDSGDPRWKETRIPFCRGDEYIDGKLAFMVEFEGVSYGIAIPFDDPVAILEETRANTKNNNEDDNDDNGYSIKYIHPDSYQDDEENQELMEIFAAQVKEQFGEEYTLRKTPKVLTISGGLDKILTNDWKRGLVMPRPATVQELLEDDNDDEDLDDQISEFYKFMRDELGDEEFEKTMNEEELSEEDKQLLEFFNVPGLGGDKDDLAGLEELIKEMQDEVDEVKEAKQFEPNIDGASLKLIGYTFADGRKSYTLVKLLQPYILIGKYDEASANQQQSQGRKDTMIRFDLLTTEEEQIIIPKLEEICRDDMKAAGLSFPKAD